MFFGWPFQNVLTTTSAVNHDQNTKFCIDCVDRYNTKMMIFCKMAVTRNLTELNANTGNIIRFQMGSPVEAYVSCFL